jgi:hypothetical protein
MTSASPADRTEDGRLIERDAWRFDTFLLAERLDFCVGEFLNVHSDFGTVEHNDAAFATWTPSHDGHKALLTSENGIVRQRKPESATSR